MPEADFIKLNIAVQPPEDVFRIACKYSNQCPGSSRIFTLDKFRIPHITIYYAEFPKENLDKILAKLAEVCEQTKAFDMNFQKTAFAYNYFMAYFDLNPALKELHYKTLKEINPLRENHLKEKYQINSPEMALLNKEEQGNALKYGHINAGSTYFPHLTITCYLDKHPLISEMPKINFDKFRAEKIIIFTGGDTGTSEKIIKSFKLNG